jgi:hypothetical protein
MTIQLGVTERNARADVLESTIGASPILEIRTGGQPANCAAADSGTLLASAALPADWLTASASGVKTLQGVWQDASVDGAGTAGHFRIYNAGRVRCCVQGSVTVIGGGGDITMNSVTFVLNQFFTVTAGTWTEPGA